MHLTPLKHISEGDFTPYSILPRAPLSETDHFSCHVCVTLLASLLPSDGNEGYKFALEEKIIPTLLTFATARMSVFSLSYLHSCLNKPSFTL